MKARTRYILAMAIVKALKVTIVVYALYMVAEHFIIHLRERRRIRAQVEQQQRGTRQ